MAPQPTLEHAYQRRFQRAPKLSVRQQDGGGLVVGGYAIVFDSPTVIAGYFEETISPDVRIEYAEGDVFSLFNHNWDNVLGRLGAGTLSLDRRTDGLYAETTLADNEFNRALAQSIERGDIAGQSFGFDLLAERWDTAGDMPKSDVEHIRLYETTITPIPAYPDTDIEVQARARLDAFEKQHSRQAEKQSSLLRLEMAQRKAQLYGRKA